MRVLRLTDVTVARTSISASCALEDLRFHATVWYDDIDLHELQRTYGNLVDATATTLDWTVDWSYYDVYYGTGLNEVHAIGHAYIVQ